MYGLAWGAVLVPVFLIAPAITAVACALYARRYRTPQAFALLTGAAGVLLVELLWSAFTLLLASHLVSALSTAKVFNATNQLHGVGQLVFGVLFSISLLLVLKDAPTARTPTEQALQPDALKVGA